MLARGLLIGLALVAMGLLHLFGSGGWTAVIGAALLAATGLAWLIRNHRAAR